MKEYKFNTENIIGGEVKYPMYLLQDNDRLYLSLRKDSQEIKCIEVLHISKLKKLTNFFQRGFNISLEGIDDELTIPLEDLMEKERKIIISGNNFKEKVTIAEEKLIANYEAKINREKYQRCMVYMDTIDLVLKKRNCILRLTEEFDDVKATIHMGNNLNGDEKYILKFFFTHTNMNEVIEFFKLSLGLVPITKEVLSTRIEYKCNFGEVAVDFFETDIPYSVIELELDSYSEDNDDSKFIDSIAKNIADKLNLDDCEVVDLGTEAIYTKITGTDFFDAMKP